MTQRVAAGPTWAARSITSRHAAPRRLVGRVELHDLHVDVHPHIRPHPPADAATGIRTFDFASGAPRMGQ